MVVVDRDLTAAGLCERTAPCFLGGKGMTDHRRRPSVETGKGTFAKQRCRSVNWIDLPSPAQDENRQPLPHYSVGAAAGDRLDGVSLGAAFKRAHWAEACSGGGALALEDVGKGEIRRILNDSQMASSPRTTFLGVSPPVRGGLYGGAANPLSQDSNWRRCARIATASSLQALRERDLQGVSFLRSGCVGDSKLLLGSPGRDPCAGDFFDDADSACGDGDNAGQPFACSARYFDL